MTRPCADCQRRPAADGHAYCEPCRVTYQQAIRRRREAQRRLPPLDQRCFAEVLTA